jgi:hypothetical protein
VGAQRLLLRKQPVTPVASSERGRAGCVCVLQCLDEVLTLPAGNGSLVNEEKKKERKRERKKERKKERK